MAWPLKANAFQKNLTVKEALKYLLMQRSLTISPKTLLERAREFPKMKLGNSYDRDGIDEVASAGHFQHKNLNH